MSTAASATRLRITLVVLLLIGAALGSFWLLETLRRGAEDTASDLPKGEPDYTVEQFSAIRLSKAGQVHYSISGKQLAHYPDTDIFEIQSPVIRSIDKQQIPITLEAELAVIEEGGDKVHMHRKVRLERPAAGKRDALQVSSEYLLFLPNDEIVQTDRAVEITTGRSRLAGVGMHVNNGTREFRILSNVRGKFETPARR